MKKHFSTIQAFLKKTYAKHIYLYLRKQKLISALFGPLYTRSRALIEIAITYRCNLHCFNCDISCRQAPSTEEMTVAQIEKFVRESVDKKISWERIRILGGEPTLHLHLRDILNILSDYKKKYSPRTAIVIFSNGFGQQVQTVLLSLPGEIEVFNTAKKHVYQQFRCFNLAPVDSCLYRWSDYTNGCAVIANCGIGLTPSGYYPCIVAGGIDRIFGLNKGRYNVPDNNDDMRDQLKVFCKLCGHFRPPKISDQEKMSHTWKRAYKKYALSPPALTPY